MTGKMPRWRLYPHYHFMENPTNSEVLFPHPLLGSNSLSQTYHFLRFSGDDHERGSKMKVPKDRFGKYRKELQKLLKRCQLIAYALGRITGLDPTFIKKLVVGDRNSSRKTVPLIAKEIRVYTSLISDSDIDRLIKASGN